MPTRVQIKRIPRFYTGDESYKRLCGLYLSLSRNDVHERALVAGGKLHCTSCESEESVVAAASNVLTGVELGATLANEDLSCLHLLATVPLHTQALCL